jgi:hypothetical protein
MQFEHLRAAALSPNYAILVNFDLEQIVITTCINFHGFTNVCLLHIAHSLGWEIADHDIAFGTVEVYATEELWGFELFRYEQDQPVYSIGKIMMNQARRKVRVKRKNQHTSNPLPKAM